MNHVAGALSGGRWHTFNQLNFNIMANYPKFELVGNEKDYLDHVWSTKLWDVSQMPSKLYMRNKDGSLVAIRPMFFVSLKNDREYACGTSEVFGFEKAGEGLCIKRVDTYFPSYDFFVSPEDYERYKACGDGAYQIPILFTTDILRECDYKWDSNGILVWHEENGEPKRVLIPDYRLWIDRDGAHIEPLTTKCYFKTREECARTIPKAQVMDFDEPAPEPADQQWLVDLPKTVAVTAKTEEEAKEKVRQGLNSILK